MGHLSEIINRKFGSNHSRWERQVAAFVTDAFLTMKGTFDATAGKRPKKIKQNYACALAVEKEKERGLRNSFCSLSCTEWSDVAVIHPGGLQLSVKNLRRTQWYSNHSLVRRFFAYRYTTHRNRLAASPKLHMKDAVRRTWRHIPVTYPALWVIVAVSERCERKAHTV